MPEASEIESLQNEVAILRQRVADLQRDAARFDSGTATETHASLMVSISEREELLREAERIVQMGSWVWDIERNTVFWSDQLFRILGHDPANYSASVDAFFAAIHPDDRARVQAVSKQGVASGLSPQVDFRVQRPDGSIRHATMGGAMLFDDAGKLRRIVGTVLDQTDSRQSREVLAETNRLLSEAQSFAHLGSWRLDVATGTLFGSGEFRKILGIVGDAPLSRSDWIERIHSEDQVRMAEVFEQVLRTGSSAELGARILHSPQSYRYVRIKCATEHDGTGDVFALRGTMLDATDYTRMQQRLAQAEKMEAIGRLAGGIAHDFNNLMTVVRSSIELLDNSDPDALNEIKNAIESARTLTGRLLAFGQQSTLRPKSVELNDIIRNTVLMVGRVLGEHISIRQDLAADLPRVDLDEQLTGQALINLLINARDAMPRGGRVVLTTRAINQGGKSVIELLVMDNGNGIDEITRAHLFEPFFTTKSDGEGSGLGLAMVLGTVEQQGGTIAVETPKEGGTRFVLRFPASRRLFSPTPRSPINVPVAVGRTFGILVVEDQAAVAAVVGRLLEREGHRVFLAERPSVALDVFARNAADIELIICDLIMPEMFGPALIKEIAARWPLPRILYVSGYGADATKDVDPEHIILAKPFTPEELRDAMSRVMA
ncbi:MAG: PAS domain-containing protein [Deltaproteobacteria bacterium]|nr:PAS domain-containing protein [Deltaproteobacteria bacterium]